jgi:hypothetical protein
METTNKYEAVRLAWRTAVPFPEPQENFIRGWLRSVSLADIQAIMNRLQNMYSRGFLDSERAEDHAGRFVSACVRRAKEQNQPAPASQPKSQYTTASDSLVVLPDTQKEGWRASWPDASPVAGYGSVPFGSVPFGQGE